MFASFSVPFGLFSSRRRSSSTGTSGVLKLKPVPVYDLEESTERRDRTLKHLLKANHNNHSIIYHHLQFHNHCPHVLGSAYILGATSEQLNTIYDAESKSLEPWQDSPGEISEDDWRDFLGKREYQRAYVHFFEDQLVSYGYDWQGLLEHYLYEGEQPVFNSLLSGLGHPLIHLGYAYEMSSHVVAVEALALGTCFHSDLHKYLDDPSYTRPSSYKSTSVLEILKKVANDGRFKGLFDHQGADNIDELLKQREDAVLDHWNAWAFPSDPQSHFEESQKAAVAVVVGTPHPPSTSDGKKMYDFFLLHLLTTSHATRTLLPIVPVEFQTPLIRQWFLFVLLAYIAQICPKIDLSKIDDYPLDGRDWKHVVHAALTSDHATDAHFVKGLRAMKVAAATWGDDKQFYLKAAVRMAAEFDGWGGFGALTTGYRPYF